jgi:hypothetical protein
LVSKRAIRGGFKVIEIALVRRSRRGRLYQFKDPDSRSKDNVDWQYPHQPTKVTDAIAK